MKTMPAGRPRILRGVQRLSYNKKTKRYKSARDHVTGVRIERVKSASLRPCASKQCIYRDGLIHHRTDYVKVTDALHGPHVVLRGRSVPQPLDYHPDCVPSRALPLVRFVIPMPWRACTVTEWQGSASKRLFTSPEAWLLWCDRHYPEMRKTWSNNLNGNFDSYQLGTNYYWSQLFKM